MNGPVGRNAARRPLPRSGLLQQVCVYDQVPLAAAKTFFRWCVVEKKWLARNALEVVKGIGRAAETGARGAHRREAGIVRRRHPQHLGERLQSFPSVPRTVLFNRAEKIRSAFVELNGIEPSASRVRFRGARAGRERSARLCAPRCRRDRRPGSRAPRRVPPAPGRGPAARTRDWSGRAARRCPRRLRPPWQGRGGAGPRRRGRAGRSAQQPGRGTRAGRPRPGRTRQRCDRRRSRRRSRRVAAATRIADGRSRRARRQGPRLDAGGPIEDEAHGQLGPRDQRREVGPAADEDEPVVGSVNQRPAIGIEQRGARVLVGVGHERGRDAEAGEQRLPLGAREIVAAEEGVERRPGSR